ncbi:MAG: excisionase family DNA-binding protein [Thermodesulfobacteriota bacterium]|nr:excisionase family DNA-binding protein [Thermodesulfobacteriota bacterium]
MGVLHHNICQYLGISNDTVYRWINNHNMPAHRMGCLWKFERDKVDNRIKSGGARQNNDIKE